MAIFITAISLIAYHCCLLINFLKLF